MARKRSGDELKKDIREKNGRFYAYRSTSEMVGGKKVTKTEYLGPYDPNTDTVKEKRVRGKQRSKADISVSKEEMDVKSLLKGISFKQYGNVDLLDTIQRRSRLGRDLTLSFGSSAKPILCSAMAVALNGSTFMNIEDTMERSFIREMYGSKATYDSPSMSEFAHRIGTCNDNIDSFFEYRVGASEGMLAWDTTTKGTYSLLDGLAEWARSKDDERIPMVKKALATDGRGVPALFEIYPGTMSDMATMKQMVDRIRRYGREDLMLVMDRGFGSGANIHLLNAEHTSFVMPANTNMKTIKAIMSEFQKRKNDRRVFDSHAYDVWETELAVVINDDSFNTDGEQMYAIVAAGDAPPEAELVRAYVCYDSKKYSDEVQRVRVMVDELVAKLEMIDSKDPMREFTRITGKAKKYFDAEADGRKLRFSVKNNAMSFAENRAGLFVMLSSTDVGWERMMSAYDARRLVEQNFDFDKADDRRFRTGDSVTMMGREFIRFVALIMKCEIAAVLRDTGINNSVNGVLDTLSTVPAAGRDGDWTVMRMTKKCRDLYSVFDMQRRSEPLFYDDVCHPAEVIEAFD